MHTRHITLWSGTLCLTVLALALLTGAHQVWQHLDADALFPVSLYRDLWQRPYPVWGWNLPPAPSFAPDLALLFPWLAIFTDLRWAYAAYALVLGAVFVLLLASLARALLDDPKSTQAAPSRALLAAVLGPTLVLLALAYESPNQLVLVDLLMPGFHGGSLVFTLALILLAADAVARPKARPWRGFGLVYGLGIVGTMADALLLAQGIIPLVLALHLIGLNQPEKGAYRRLAAHLGVAGLSGLGLALACTKLGLGRYAAGRGQFFAQSPWRSVQSFVQDLPAIASAEGPLLLLTALGLVLISLHLLRHQALNAPQRLVYLTLALATLLSPAAAVLNGGYDALPVIRRMLPLFVLPGLAFGIIVQTLLSIRTLHFFAVAVALLLAIRQAPQAMLAFADDKPLSLVRDIDCLEQRLAEDWQLQDGLADYWRSKTINELSRLGLWTNQLTPAAKPYAWINNPAWWYHRPEGERHAWLPRYIVINGLQPNILSATFGPPDGTIVCGALTAWIYQQGETLDQRLKSKNYRP